jgi:deoxyhypusine synthase
MVSSGVREVIRYLVEKKMVDCLVTTTGGIEEDLMKSKSDFQMGSFQMDDKQNRLNGHCRIGNILVTNSNYIKLEEFLLPLFQQLYLEQE